MDASTDGLDGGTGGADANGLDGQGDDGKNSAAVLCGSEVDAARPSRCSGAEICCVGNASSSTPTYTCQAASVACSGTVVSCASASDCPSGQVCCGWLSSTGYSSAACVSGCVGEDGEEAVQFCDLNAPVCPPSKMCRPALFLRGYGACE